jgi:hypothetical protein
MVKISNNKYAILKYMSIGFPIVLGFGRQIVEKFDNQFITVGMTIIALLYLATLGIFFWRFPEKTSK